jgi:hypothetical protein
MRGGAVAARRAHNPKVRGSNPLPATIDKPQVIMPAVFWLKMKVQDSHQIRINHTPTVLVSLYYPLRQVIPSPATEIGTYKYLFSFNTWRNQVSNLRPGGYGPDKGDPCIERTGQAYIFSSKIYPEVIPPVCQTRIQSC